MIVPRASKPICLPLLPVCTDHSSQAPVRQVCVAACHRSRQVPARFEVAKPLFPSASAYGGVSGVSWFGDPPLFIMGVGTLDATAVKVARRFSRDLLPNYLM